MVASTKKGTIDPEEIESEINAYKQLLKQTDYQALKFAEGQISEADYEPIKERRQDLRDKINALEDEM